MLDVELQALEGTFSRDVIAMSFAPEDEHEAQVHFALERGIPAISAVMGTQRLPSPVRCLMPFIVHVAESRGTLKVENFCWSLTFFYVLVVILFGLLPPFTKNWPKMWRYGKLCLN